MTLRAPLLMAFCALAACRSVPTYMREVDPARRISANDDEAVVVFVRSSKFGFAVRAHVADGEGHFLGTAIAGGHFAVKRKPGPQRFVVYSEAADVLIASLAPGRVYFAEVNPAMGVLRARFTFRTSHKGNEIFPYKKDLLDDTTQYEVDPRLAADETREGQDEIRERLQQAEERARELQGDDLKDHTLSPDDGHIAVGVAAPAYSGPALVTQAPAAGWATPPPPPPPAPEPAPAVVTRTQGHASAPAAATPAASAPAARPAVGASGAPALSKGQLLCVTAVNGLKYVGELVAETANGLLLSTGSETQLLLFTNIGTIDVLVPR